MIEKILVLSTAHMHDYDPDFGDIRVLKGTYEHIAVVNMDISHSSPFEPKLTHYAEWFRPIIKAAWVEGCSYVCFEQAADADNRFEIYEW